MSTLSEEFENVKQDAQDFATWMTSTQDQITLRDGSVVNTRHWYATQLNDPAAHYLKTEVDAMLNGLATDVEVAQAVSDALVSLDDDFAAKANASEVFSKEESTAMVGEKLNKRRVTKISRNGNNNLMVLLDGNLYSAAGNSGGVENAGTGLFADANNSVARGVGNLKRVYFPEATAKIIDFGGNGYASQFTLFDNGNLYTWGKNGLGSCGLGHSTVTNFPTLAATDVEAVFIQTWNIKHSIANSALYIKKTDGYCYATGDNSEGELGLGDVTNRNVFTKIDSLGLGVRYIWNNAGYYGFSFAQKDDGTIWATGYNGYGGLGTGDTTNRNVFTDVTTAWGGTVYGDILDMGLLSGYYSTVQYAGNFTMMLRKDAGGVTRVLTCGDGSNGKIGNGLTVNSSAPYLVPNSDDVKEIMVAGGAPGVIGMLKNSGDYYCWGYNGQGQVGDGTLVQKTEPVLVSTGVEKLFSHGLGSHTYSYEIQNIIRKSDGLYIAGMGTRGELGNGATVSSSVFVKARIPEGEVVELFGSFYTSGSARIMVAYTDKDRLYAWGYNAHHGISDTAGSNVLVPINFDLPQENS